MECYNFWYCCHTLYNTFTRKWRKRSCKIKCPENLSVQCTLWTLEAVWPGLHVKPKAGPHVHVKLKTKLESYAFDWYNDILIHRTNNNKIIIVDPAYQNWQQAYFNHTDSFEHGMVLNGQIASMTFYLSFPEANSWFYSLFGRMSLPFILIAKWVIQSRIFNKPNWNLNRLESQFTIRPLCWANL